MTTEPHRLRLLRIARHAIVAHVNGVSAPVVDTGDLGARRGGAFVSLHAGDQLRGCIGHIEADDLLPRVVARCAVSACSADPRFPPVSPLEVGGLAIEVSVLGPLERIAGPRDVTVGRHGLVVDQGRRRGVLLPQVAIEWNWDSDAFLGQTCRKAGLSRLAWKQGATLWRFEAEVFAEAGRAGGPGGAGGGW